MKGVFTKITSCSSILSKQFSLVSDGLRQESVSSLYDGYAEKVSFSGIKEFKNHLESVNKNQCFMYGVFSEECVQLTTKKNQKNLEAVSRNKETVQFSNSPGILCIDYDPKETVLSREELREVFITIIPELANVQMMIVDSTSSFIWDSDKVLRGEKGKKIYIPIIDTSDRPRIDRILYDRLWLNGYGFINVEVSGRLTDKSIMDKAMLSPVQLDYVAGAVLDSPLVQKTRQPLIWDGVWFDSRAINDLSKEEKDRVNELIKQAKNESNVITLSNNKKNEYIEHCAKEMNVDHLKATNIINRALNNNILSLDFVLYSSDKIPFSVRAIADNPDYFHGMNILDPIEPSYDNWRPVAKIFTDKGIVINSFAHHGVRYTCESGYRKHKPKFDSNVSLPNLLEQEQMDEEICQIGQDFIQNKTKIMVSSSVGSGKSRKFQELIKNGVGSLFIYTTPNHKLSFEVDERYRDIEVVKPIPFFHNSTIVKGITKVCENPMGVQFFEKHGFNKTYCDKFCHFQRECAYWTQNEFHQIKIYHNNVVSDGVPFVMRGETKKSERKPRPKTDYLIIDEDFLKLESHFLMFDTKNDVLKGVMDEIKDTKTFQSLLDSNISTEPFLTVQEAINHQRDVFHENFKSDLKKILEKHSNKIINQHNKLLKMKSEIPRAVSPEDMASKLKISGTNLIFDRFVEYVTSKNEKALSNLFLNQKGIALNKMKGIHSDFINTPTAILDASCNKNIMNILFPDFTFHSLHAKKSDEVTIRQVCDKSFSKSSIIKMDRHVLIKGLEEIINRYNREDVVLITYKNLGEELDFAVNLGHELGLENENVGWFRNTRGIDCWKHKHLILLGVPNIPLDNLIQYYQAVYDKPTFAIFKYEDTIIRMNNDTACLVSNRVSDDQKMNDIYDQFVRSELIQNAGRNRPFRDFGLKRDTWILTNTSLGVYFPVNDVFMFDDFFGNDETKNNEVVRRQKIKDEFHQERVDLILRLDLKEIKDSRKTYLDLGLSTKFVDRERNKVHLLLEECGYRLEGKVWNRS